LTWGIFGLVTGGIPSLIISAVSGALFGGWAARSHAHHLSQKELERLGTQLPADSSALLTYVQGENADAVLNAARSQTPGAASAAVIDNQLQAQVMSDTGEAPNAVADQPATDELTPRLSMLLFRYDDPKAAQRVAAALTTRGGAEPGAPEVELIVQLDNAGHRHVKAPTFGVGAVATYDVRAWGGFGLVMGALAGFTGGYGFIGFLGGGIVTGIAWGLFGLAAGALYGLWVGKTVSARRVKGIAPLVTPGTSFLLGWGETPLSERHRQALMDNSEPRRLILSFRPIGHGATLERIPT
jgi:hypothetical protein